MYIYTTLIIIIICIIYFYLIKNIYTKKHSLDFNNLIKLNNNIDFNLSNIDKLNLIFKQTLNKRINLLKNMSYTDWINYNKNNNYITINGINYYFWIYERSNNEKLPLFPHFINKVSDNLSYQDLSFNDIQKVINDNLGTTTYKVNQNLIENIFYSKTDFSILSFYWGIQFENNKFYDSLSPIRNKIISTKFNKDGVDGIIGIVYNVENIISKITYTFYNLINKYLLLFIIIFIFFIAYILQYINKGKCIIPIVFLISLNLYIMYFLNQNSEQADYHYLIETAKDITTSTLSIAFLITANIFIINYMGTSLKKNHSSLYYSNVILFCASMFFLLLSLYKVTAILTDNDIRIIFLNKEILYNIVIVINLLILINYLYHIKLIYDNKYLKKLIVSS
jgi:hypothetical protein